MRPEPRLQNAKLDLEARDWRGRGPKNAGFCNIDEMVDRLLAICRSRIGRPVIPRPYNTTPCTSHGAHRVIGWTQLRHALLQALWHQENFSFCHSKESWSLHYRASCCIKGKAVRRAIKLEPNTFLAPSANGVTTSNSPPAILRSFYPPMSLGQSQSWHTRHHARLP